MRLVAMLLALLIIGLLIYKQTGNHDVRQAEQVQNAGGPNVPKAPTRPEDVKQFGAQMDKYMQDEAAKRAADIEKAESQ